MTSQPEVSVILPTWNRATLVREAIESVVRQTFEDWELLVSDDGSTDGTAEIVEGLGEVRVRVVKGGHTGRPSIVRNRGLREAKGRWVAFLDSDDRWHREKLKQQLEAHRAAPDARWSYTGRRMIDGEGRVLPDDDFAPWRPLEGWILDALLVHEAMVALPTVMVERALISDLGGFDESLAFSEDYDLWLRLAQRSPVLCIDRRLADVRIHGGNTTRHNPAVNASFSEVYRRLAKSHPAAGVRRTSRRQEAHYRTFLAGQLRDRGDRLGALTNSARAVAASPTDRRVWWSLAKSAFAPGKPERVGRE